MVRNQRSARVRPGRFRILPGALGCAAALVLSIPFPLRAACTSGGGGGSGGLTELSAFSVSQSSGEKPMSKLWENDGRWFCVMPDNSGTWLRRLDGTSWTKLLELSSSTSTQADALRDGNVTHVLLYRGSSSQLVSVQYNTQSHDYSFWSQRPSASSVNLGSSGEAGTIAIDGTGRMWAASDGSSTALVWYSDSPYSSWSGPVTVASGIKLDDICVVTKLSGGKIGVMWSDQNSKRFGFKTHTDGNSPSSWGSNEVPASQSALSVGSGMADDHINLALGADGTLYAAVKTSYDTSGYPKLACLVRHTNGQWESLHEVTQSGTRPVVVIDTDQNRLIVAYTASEGYHNLMYRTSSLTNVSFSSAQTLLGGSLNNVTSTKESVSGGPVFLAAGTSDASSVKFGSVSAPPEAPQDLVGLWEFEESGDPLLDSSDYGNDATTTGNVAHVPGVIGSALDLSGGYAHVPSDASLDICSGITLAAWIRPESLSSQYILKKAINNSQDGFELGLMSSGKVFGRFNQDTSGNTYRIQSASTYPSNGHTWMHVAVTYDGSRERIYVNGVEENNQSATFTIGTNALDLAIGADSGGSSRFTGTIDEATVYSYALSASEVAALAVPPVGTSAPEVMGDTRLHSMPNPFSSSTTFAVPASNAGEALRIYDVRGRMVRELLPAPGNDGHLVWDGRDSGGSRVAAGTYLVRLGVGKDARTGKVLFLR
jgi:Concanavalin A-like lectin/glucanases superfamily